jgi:hypothetical protein
MRCYITRTDHYRSGACIPGTTMHDRKRLGHQPGRLYLLQRARTLEVGIRIQAGISVTLH